MITAALAEGVRRVNRSRRMILLVFGLNAAFALPLAVVMRDAIAAHSEMSLAQDRLRTGFDLDWYGEFHAQATGLPASFSPSVIGFGAVLDNLDAFVTGTLTRQFSAIVGAGVAYVVLWAFLIGGVIEIYALADGGRSRDRLFGAGARHFFRMLRLAALAALLYYVIFAWVAAWLATAVDRITRDVTVERTEFLWRMAAYAIVALLALVVNLAFDYAKIRTVLEERRSMLLAATAGLRFAFQSPARTFGLYFLIGGIGLVIVAAYAAFVPGARQSTWSGVAAAFLVGQVYLMARIWVRLTFFGSQVALFQAMGGPVLVETRETASAGPSPAGQV